MDEWFVLAGYLLEALSQTYSNFIFLRSALLLMLSLHFFFFLSV